MIHNNNSVNNNSSESSQLPDVSKRSSFRDAVVEKTENVCRVIFFITCLPVGLSYMAHDSLYTKAKLSARYYVVVIPVDLVLVTPCLVFTVIAVVELVAFEGALRLVGGSLDSWD